MKKIQLSIQNPCHEKWENMTPVERGKFCNSCQKKVIDFSRMTDREIALFLKRSSTGSVCGRFMNDQLNREIEIPRKRIPWVKYFFQFSFPAFLISLKANSQKKIVKPTIVYAEKKRHFNDTLTLPEIVLLDYKPLSKAALKSSTRNMTSNSEFGNNNSEEDNFVGTVGLVMVCRRFGKTIDTVFKEDFYKSEVKKDFKPFPNPVNSGGTLNIKWNQTEAGYFSLQLFNLAGQQIINKEMWVDGKNTLLNFELPNVASGNYVVRMTNKKTGKTYSEKIIIQ